MSKELPSSIEESPAWASDINALKEEKNWPDLDKLKAENKFWLVRVIGWIAPVAMVIFSLVFVAFFVSWSLHYLLPECWQWLKDEQLSKIQSVIFSGAIGAIVSSYVKKQID